MKRYEKKIEISKEIEVTFETPLFTGDIGNTIGLEFYLRGKPYEFTSATLFGTNKAGETVFTTAKVEGHTVVLPIVNAMFQVPVKADMQVVLYDDLGNALTSGYLHFTVIQGLSENASIEGTDEYNSLMELLAQVNSSMDQISRAESAAATVEQLLQKVPQLENQVVKFLTLYELEHFTSGFAIVSGSQTADNGNTEYYYFPVVAESFNSSGILTVRQTRFLNGKIEQRFVGGEWTAYSFTYKGSLESTKLLPEKPSKGDIYNIETQSSITVTGTNSKIRYLIPILGVIDSQGKFSAYFNSEYFSWLISTETGEIELFDKYGDSLGIALLTSSSSDGEIEVRSTSLAPGTFIDYIQLPNQEDNLEAPGEAVIVYEKEELPVMPKQKVFYNGKEWDVFAGNLSGYVTKEELGNMEEALDAIIAIQDSLIQEGA